MDLNSIIVISLILIVFLGFILEKLSPDIIALLAVSVLLILGILETKEFLTVFGNSAAITIAMMFVISSALERTGCLQIVTTILTKGSGSSCTIAMLLVMIVAMVISAFMNNTPVVIVMTPVVVALAASLNIPASKLLIPLSFSAIFGGTATLIGTSTNIIISDLTMQSNLPEIHLFEMTIPALIFALFGIFYMITIGRFLLPNRHSISSILDGQPKRQFIAELQVSNKSNYIGKTVNETNLIKKKAKILDVIRNGDSFFNEMDSEKLRLGDRIIIETNVGEILDIKEDGHVEFKNSNRNFQGLKAEKRVVMEATIPSKSNLNERYVSNLNLQSRYGVYILAINHNEKSFKKDFDEIKLSFGDTLLIEGSSQGIARLIEEGNVINLNHPKEKSFRKSKAPIAFLTLAMVIILAALKIIPIAGAAIIGAVTVMATKCVDPDEAYKAIDWRILFLIFGMLGLSMAMQKTGAASFMINHVIDYVKDLSPLTTLIIIYVLTSILTEMISNNAVVVLITPLVISLSAQLGYDSRPFIMAVMFAASSSFATPIGYQTNTFIYSAGGYKFTDFVKIGLPLNILFAILSAIFLPMFFPF